MTHRTSLLFSLVIATILPFTLLAQGVSINETGDPADNSAMLDIQSSDKGVLIPRLTTVQRTAIAVPADGLLVFDINTQTFWFKESTGWTELADSYHGLQDMDHDTKVQVEESPDEDKIRFDIGGVESMMLERTPQNAVRLDVGPTRNLFVGRNAGLNSIPGENTFIGYQAGENSDSGERNVFMGYQAGQNNGPDQHYNVFLGFRAGQLNDAPGNTFTGHESGLNNTTGEGNSFYGDQSGLLNKTGARNTLIGQRASLNNTDGVENTTVGFAAGYNTTFSANTFIGAKTGYANRTGGFNTVVGHGAAGNEMPATNMGHGNSILGFQAGFSADGMAFNTLAGFRAGYNLTSGNYNILVGRDAGYNTTDATSNIALGTNALRENINGSRNIAIGDSSLLNSSVSNLIAIGSKAGRDNTTGPANTFIGYRAGEKNTDGSFNTVVGNLAAPVNASGSYNTFVGAESANSNIANNNVFVGYSAGFRNAEGSGNTFVGTRTATYNTDGRANVAVGLESLNANSDGNNNIAIGELALGTNLNEGWRLGNNIGIGNQAGRDLHGDENIIVGNRSAINMNANFNIAIGNDIDPRGTENILIGNNTSVHPFGTITHATAIGHGTTLLQGHTVILGDTQDKAIKVGVGTGHPTAKLHVAGEMDSVELFRVTSSGATALRVYGNEGASVGTSDPPAAEGLLVQGNSVFRANVNVQDTLRVNTTVSATGYVVSVDGNIACEEVRVQDSGMWPDYVFEEDYELTNLSQLESYLKENKHLPGIPSAAEVAANGVMVGDMQKRLLEKIEELTLHTIRLEKRIAELESIKK